MTPVDVARALCCYLYNTSAVRFVTDIYGEVHPDYAEEKISLYLKSQMHAVGALDDANFAKLVGIALARHGKVEVK